MIDVTKISDTRDEGWQRTAVQFLDDTRHEPISRISASTRELKRIVSLFEREKENVQCDVWSWEVERRSLMSQFCGTTRKGFSANLVTLLWKVR